MKCDDFLSHLTTGNFVQRMMARLHARKCANCRRAAEQVLRLQRELSEIAPLTDRQRELWLAAATGSPSAPATDDLAIEIPADSELPSPETPDSDRKLRVLLAIAAVAAAIVLAVFFSWDGNVAPNRGPGTGPTANLPGTKDPGTKKPGTLVQSEDPDRTIGDLRGSLLALAERLEELESQASLIDERVAVAEIVGQQVAQ